jgi:hypothetical protein|tara:strand:+ start:373 stop:837 length:465 start_codon:yes stop_codon:yes gene_type:complete
MSETNETKTLDTSPFKVLKLDNGEDVICKILHEYTDAVVVERPMAIAENPHFNEQLGEVITHTGLQHWMNFTNDTEFAIAKKRIIAVGNLAPEVGFYYKQICKKLALRDEDNPKDETELKNRIQALNEIMKNVNTEEDGPKKVIQFPLDKTKLH